MKKIKKLKFGTLARYTGFQRWKAVVRRSDEYRISGQDVYKLEDNSFVFFCKISEYSAGEAWEILFDLGAVDCNDDHGRGAAGRLLRRLG